MNFFSYFNFIFVLLLLFNPSNQAKNIRTSEIDSLKMKMQWTFLDKIQNLPVFDKSLAPDCILNYGPFGSLEGKEFDLFHPQDYRINELSIESIEWGLSKFSDFGTYIHYLKINYNNGKSFEVNNVGNSKKETTNIWKVPDGEIINKIEIFQEKFIFGIQFFTKEGSFSPVLGRSAGSKITISLNGGELIGITGRMGMWLNGLTFISNACRQTCYKFNTYTFGKSLDTDKNFNSFKSVKDDFLVLEKKENIMLKVIKSNKNNIRVNYLDFLFSNNKGVAFNDGLLDTNEIKTMKLKENNHIYQIKIKFKDELVNGFTFETDELKNYSFGDWHGEYKFHKFNSKEKLIGFYGRSRIDNISQISFVTAEFC